MSEAKIYVPKLLPFSIQCFDCDADQGLTFEQAVAEGWTGIEDNDGLAWNQLGYCPDCAKAEAEYIAEQRAKRLAKRRPAKGSA